MTGPIPANPIDGEIYFDGENGNFYVYVAKDKEWKLVTKEDTVPADPAKDISAIFKGLTKHNLGDAVSPFPFGITADEIVAENQMTYIAKTLLPPEPPDFVKTDIQLEEKPEPRDPVHPMQRFINVLE